MKSDFFDDATTSSETLKCESSIECKQLSKEITDYNHENWAPATKAICEWGIAAKFLQNANLSKELLNTGDKVLVECSYDELWGNGIPLGDEFCLDRERWTNQGILGEILMEVRTELKCTTEKSDVPNLNTDCTSTQECVENASTM